MPRSPWGHLARYRGQVLLGCAALALTSALLLAVPWLLGRVIEGLKAGRPAGEIAALAGWMVALAVAQAAARIASRILLFNAARMAEYDLRADLFARLLSQAGSFFRKHTTGDVMSRLTTDVQTTRALWGPGVLNMVNTTILFGAALVLMVRIDWELALWTLTPYPLMVLGGRLFSSRLFRWSRSVQEYLGEVSGAVQEDLAGIAVIKSYTAESRRVERFAGMADELCRRNMKLAMVRMTLMPILGGLGALGTAAIIYIGAQAVIGGRLTLGELIQFNTYLALLVWPTMALGWMLSLFQRGYAAWRRLDELLAAEPTIQDGAGPPLTEDVRGDLEIRNLTVELGGRRVLDGVSLRARPGTITAIVGRTGSGKSVLAETLPRLIEIPSGTIFLDGVDITTLPLANLRRAIGYAPQEAFLFSSSIARNILFGIEHTARAKAPAGDADGSASDPRAAADHVEGPRYSELEPHIHDAVERSARAAGLAHDLAALPDSYDTLVGERGITLSGGQRQRVALARALASDPAVLVLDDSLSSVDTETEREILGHLDEVMKGRTSILISHRVGAIRRADQIVVLDRGRVVESGSHAELLRAGGVYADLYQSQLRDNAIGEEGAA